MTPSRGCEDQQAPDSGSRSSVQDSGFRSPTCARNSNSDRRVQTQADIGALTKYVDEVRGSAE
jgi:hypothetical protein